MEEWLESISIVDREITEADEAEWDYLFDYDPDYDDEIIDAIEGVRTETEEKKKKEKEEAERKKKERQALEDYVKNNAEGILTISKINLKLPILRGASDRNMQISVAAMAHSGALGGEGNYAIAGHRNRTYGRNFNRLDEVEVGDIIEANNGQETFTYTVTEKSYVLPSDVSVLASYKNKKEITLITCHPMGNPTHRIIIKGQIL